MKLLRKNREARATSDDYYDERPLPDEAPEPQPENREERLEDPGPGDLSKRDYGAILKRAFKAFNADHMTNIAAALAYYAFLAIPSALLIGVGLFSLLAGPHAIATLIDKLHQVVPTQATSLLESSLTTMSQHRGTGLTVLVIGAVLAVWSLTGAMVAIVIWLVASGAFSFYVSRFGSYNKTWGSLSAVVVMLTWLWLSSVALLLGAEVNAEAERSRELRRGEPAEVELQAPVKA